MNTGSRHQTELIATSTSNSATPSSARHLRDPHQAEARLDDTANSVAGIGIGSGSPHGVLEARRLARCAFGGGARFFTTTE
jgi:hypothetical protein